MTTTTKTASQLKIEELEHRLGNARAALGDKKAAHDRSPEQRVAADRAYSAGLRDGLAEPFFGVTEDSAFRWANEHGDIPDAWGAEYAEGFLESLLQRAAYNCLNCPPACRGAVMSAHTPGPWVVQGRGGLEVMGPDFKIVDLIHTEFVGDPEALAAAQADARLIAAAPDLLAALERASGLLHLLDSASARDVITQADAAIAKARGGK